MKHLKPTKSPSPLAVYLAVSLSGILFYFILLPILGNHLLEWLVMENNSDFESADYYLVLLYSLGGKNVYQFGVDACYPPLAYCFCWLMSHALSLAQHLDGVDLLEIGYQGQVGMTPQLLVLPYSLWVFLMFSVFGVLLYVFACDSLRLSNAQRRLAALSIVCSVPLLAGALERGNLTLYTAAFVLLAIQLRDSSATWKRELALILIAMAAGMKFYPAFVGLLYLQEKRWKEAIRLIVYGVLAIFVPFVFWGGVDGAETLFSTLLSLSGQVGQQIRIQYFQGILTGIAALLGRSGGRIASILNLLFLFTLILFIFLTPNRVRRLSYLAAAMALYPPNAYRYTILFFLLPLFAWLKDEAKNSTVHNYCYAVLFGLMFTIPTLFGILTGFQLNLGLYTLSYVELHLYIVVWSYLIMQVLFGIREWLQIKADD